MNEYREIIIGAFTLAVGWYGKKLTGKKDNRSGEQAFIDKLFKEIDRVDSDNKEIRNRLDKLETENRDLIVENHELKRENGKLILENAQLRAELKEAKGEI